MGLYNVIQPCVVMGRHYVRPITQPVDVDDDEAAPLVESGCLTPYRPGHPRQDHDREMGMAGLRAFDPAAADEVERLRAEGVADGDVETIGEPPDEVPEPPAPRPRRRIPEE